MISTEPYTYTPILDCLTREDATYRLFRNVCNSPSIDAGNIAKERRSHTCLLTYNTPWSRVHPEKLTGSQRAKKFPAFMEPEGSIPHSQVPATCPYPEPADTVQATTFNFLNTHLNIKLPSMNGSSKWSLSLMFPTSKLDKPLLSPYVLHNPAISFFPIFSPEQYLVRSTDH